MPGALDPNVVYRSFLDSPHHVVRTPDGAIRLASSLFRGREVSVDDGGKCTPEETATRQGDERGVVAVEKSRIAALQLTLEARESGAHRGHCVILNVGSRQAKKLRKAAVVVRPHPWLRLSE